MTEATDMIFGGRFHWPVNRERALHPVTRSRICSRPDLVNLVSNQMIPECQTSRMDQETATQQIFDLPVDVLHDRGIKIKRGKRLHFR